MIKSEICVESYAGAKIASELAYTSVEINAALDLGGLTPSFGLVRLIADNLQIEKNCMLRPRAGGFFYTESEYASMLADLHIFCKENIDGIVFGFLTEDFEVDEKRTKEFVELIHQAGKKAIFHRAFDNTKDAAAAIKTLIALKVDRLLTSGQSETALQGADLLASLQAKYGKQIEIVAGAGVKASNAKSLLEKTHVQYLHASCKSTKSDPTSNLHVSYAVYPNAPTSYICTDYQLAKELKAVIASFD